MAKTDTAACIRLAMAKRGWSGKGLATEMGVTETTVSRWRAEGCDQISTLRAIAEQLGMSFDELMKMDD